MRRHVVWLVIAVSAGWMPGCGPGQAPDRNDDRAKILATRPWERVPCPEWVKVRVPEPLCKYQGRWGLPDPYPSQAEPIAPNVAGIDFWHANHFLVYREETKDYLCGDIAPFKFDYVKGTLPTYEAVVAKYTAGLERDREKAVALVTRALPELVAHPKMPPLGPPCADNRGADDVALLASGKGWCNEQARVFVRLCQVAGIPARLIFLFYTPPLGGHVVAEFHADGRWSMADASWFCVFPGQDGHLMSTAECHANDANKLQAGETYFARLQILKGLSDEDLAGRKFAHVENEADRRKAIADAAAQMRGTFVKRSAAQIGEELWHFGVMAYPLPPAPGTGSEPDS